MISLLLMLGIRGLVTTCEIVAGKNFAGRFLVTSFRKGGAMRDMVLFSRTLLCGIIIAFLAGCGTVGQTTQTKSSHTQTGQATSNAASTPLTSVDWANFAYFSSCYGNTQTFHTKNGQATNDHIHFTIYPPTYGTLT